MTTRTTDIPKAFAPEPNPALVTRRFWASCPRPFWFPAAGFYPSHAAVAMRLQGGVIIDFDFGLCWGNQPKGSTDQARTNRRARCHKKPGVFGGQVGKGVGSLALHQRRASRENEHTGMMRAPSTVTGGGLAATSLLVQLSVGVPLTIMWTARATVFGDRPLLKSCHALGIKN